MAEGWLRFLKPHRYESYSAGIEAHGLNPLAVKVMAEVGVDISDQQSKLINTITIIPDAVISVCIQAEKNCPAFSFKAKQFHRGFDDPPKLAANASSEQQVLDCYRKVRDEIRQFIESIETLV